MKKPKLILPLTTAFIFASCGNNDKTQVANARSNPSVNVVVYDISMSTDKYAMLEGSHLKMMYHNIGIIGGGKFYGLFIKTDSEKQDPIVQDVSTLDTLPVKGNAYQQQNRRNKNKEIVAQFETTGADFVNDLSKKMLHQKTDRFSDIQHALELAKNILGNPQYATYTKNLIIISDMENDFPPDDGIDNMKPVKFGPGVRIFVVRASDGVNVGEMLGGSAYSSYAAIPDAINSLFDH